MPKTKPKVTLHQATAFAMPYFRCIEILSQPTLTKRVPNASSEGVHLEVGGMMVHDRKAVYRIHFYTSKRAQKQTQGCYYIQQPRVRHDQPPHAAPLLRCTEILSFLNLPWPNGSQLFLVRVSIFEVGETNVHDRKEEIYILAHTTENLKTHRYSSHYSSTSRFPATCTWFAC